MVFCALERGAEMLRKWVWAVLAAVWTCCSAAAEDCKLAQYVSLDVSLDAAGGPMVPMSIGGHQVHMLVDTGGIYSMLTQRRVREFGLIAREVHGGHFSSGSHVLDHYVDAMDFMLGQMKADHTQLLVMPDDLAAPDVDGTLAPDFLSRFDVEFDFAHAKLNLFKPLSCEKIPVYWTASDPYAEIPVRLDQWNHMFVEVMLDGKPFTGWIDTGSTHSFMGLDTAKEVMAISDDGLKKFVNSSGALRWYRYPFQNLVVGDVTVKHPIIDLDPKAKGHKLVLGMDMLRRLRFYVSYKKGKIFATAVTPFEPSGNDKPSLWEDRAQIDSGPEKVSRICANQELADHPLMLAHAADGCSRGPVESNGRTARFTLSCPGNKQFHVELGFDSAEHRTATLSEIGATAHITKHNLRRISSDCGDLALGSRQDIAPDLAQKAAVP